MPEKCILCGLVISTDSVAQTDECICDPAERELAEARAQLDTFRGANEAWRRTNAALDRKIERLRKEAGLFRKTLDALRHYIQTTPLLDDEFPKSRRYRRQSVLDMIDQVLDVARDKGEP